MKHKKGKYISGKSQPVFCTQHFVMFPTLPGLWYLFFFHANISGFYFHLRNQGSLGVEVVDALNSQFKAI